MSDRSMNSSKAPRWLSPSEKLAVFMQVLTGQATQREAAVRAGVQRLSCRSLAESFVTVHSSPCQRPKRGRAWNDAVWISKVQCRASEELRCLALWEPPSRRAWVAGMGRSNSSRLRYRKYR
jgi:hypothetical protein